jgi:hypothetical protein
MIEIERDNDNIIREITFCPAEKQEELDCGKVLNLQK